MCFIDYNNAFDKVRHKQLFEALKEKGLDSSIFYYYLLNYGASFIYTVHYVEYY